MVIARAISMSGAPGTTGFFSSPTRQPPSGRPGARAPGAQRRHRASSQPSTICGAPADVFSDLLHAGTNGVGGSSAALPARTGRSLCAMETGAASTRGTCQLCRLFTPFRRHVGRLFLFFPLGLNDD